MTEAAVTVEARAERADARTLWRVILASSLGTLFEWYDFYLYGSLAVFFGDLFFPPGNERAALLASLATFGAGFGVRPLGAIVFGRIGDLVGRKYTFLVTIVTMGLSAALIGFLPTYARARLWAPGAPAGPRLPPRASCRRPRGSGCGPRSPWSSCGSFRASRSAASTAAPRPTWPSTRP